MYFSGYLKVEKSGESIFLEKWGKYLNNKGYTKAVLMDLSKAFGITKIR